MANLKFDFLHAYETGERRESEPANAYQYDEGHVLEAVLPAAVTSCEIHYWIRGQEKSEAYTPGSITQNQDGSCTVTGNIPNLYFETNGELRVYIVVTDGDASITTYEGFVHICQRSMPDDYVDDDPENEATRVLIEAQTAAATATAAAETCEEVLESIPEDYSQLSDDVSDLKDGLNYGKTATAGYILTATNDGHGSTWSPVGLPSDEQTAEAVTSWLNAHPEATTTVEDHSLTYQKLVNGTLGFVTPEMFGAKGDGVINDTTAIQNAVDSGKYVLLIGEYLVSSTINISNSGLTIIGKKNSRIICNNDIVVFNITGNRCHISNIYMVGNALGTAIQCASVWNDFRDLYVTNFKYGIKLQNTTGSTFSGVMLQSIITAGITINGDDADNYFSQCIITMKQDSVGDCVFIANNVQAIIFEASSFLRGGYGVRFADNVTASQYSDFVGKVPSHCKFIGCFFDSSTVAGVLTGNSQNISFNNCWFSCRPNYGARVNGYSAFISFNGCEFLFNRCGLRIGNYAKGIIINGCEFDTNGSLSVSADDTRTSSTPAQDIWITETPVDYIITGCKFSNDLYGQYFYNNIKCATHISINENSGTTNGVITNNILSEDCTWKTVSNLSYITQSVINNNIPTLT